MQNVRGVIFDMDGLLIDSERVNCGSWKAAAKEFGYELRDEMFAEIIGTGLRESEEILKSFLGTDFPFAKARARRVELSDEFISNSGMPLRPGALELISYLDATGIKKAIATSTDRQESHKRLEAAAVRCRFDIIVTRDDVKRIKPAPDLYLMALERLRLPAEEVVVLEDSDIGMESALNAGLRCVLIPDLKPADEKARARASAVLGSLHEFQKLLEK